ncbi:MAG: single-stranded DNA-binding protein, partial [Bacilli bacterium]
DGNNRKAFEIVANNVHFAEAKRDSASRGSFDNSSTENSYQQQSDVAPSFENGSADDFREIPADDDLPF